MSLRQPSHQVGVELGLLLGLEVEPAVFVNGLALDSRQVEPGFGFVALEGAASHGLEHVESALARGAAAVLFDEADAKRTAGVAMSVPAVPVPELRAKLPTLARAMWGDVDQSASICGVTGTDGKTSTAVFLAQLLHTESAPCGVLGTIGNGLMGQLQSATHTTSDVLATYRAIAEFAHLGAHQVSMEVSSHALDQERVAGLTFAVGALTNLGRDHLDYHGTVERYASAKRRLFDEHAERAVFNLDDATGQKWFTEHKRPMGYSLAGHPDARWHATVLSLNDTGIQCRITAGPDAARECTLPILGRFNLSNLLCACAMAECMGIGAQDVLNRLSRIAPVVGRLECLRNAGQPVAVIDYAHTEQALHSAIAALREHVSGKLWCVFGCGGDRDPGKRPGMAWAACAADHVVLTTDNPRFEAPEAIAQDASQGLLPGHPVEVILDRKAAIEFALTHADATDCVLIAGKGHEPYQEVCGQRHAFSDHDVVRSVFGVQP